MTGSTSAHADTASCHGPAVEPAGLSRTEVTEVAERLREALGYRPGEDLERYVRRLGGRIRLCDCGQLRENGSVVVEGERRFTIYLPAYTGRLRNRFALAHELGHYILHSGFGKRPLRVAREGCGRAEWEANWFAAAFLMPEAEFRRKLGDGLTDEELAACFQVSPAAVELRKESLAG